MKDLLDKVVRGHVCGDCLDKVFRGHVCGHCLDKVVCGHVCGDCLDKVVYGDTSVGEDATHCGQHHSHGRHPGLYEKAGQQRKLAKHSCILLCA